MGTLYQLLERRAGSAAKADEAVADAAGRLGILTWPPRDEQLAGLALCARGESAEVVSKQLTWKAFEGFCSSILRAKGYRVRENITLRKPRAQIDVLGVSDGISVAVDCKHWARAAGRGALGKLVEAQKARARRLHDGLDKMGPIATVILTLVDGGERFAEGGAVVPIFAFRDFLDNIDGLLDHLELA